MEVNTGSSFLGTEKRRIDLDLFRHLRAFAHPFPKVNPWPVRIIAGPCQHESFADSLEIAEKCKEIVEDVKGTYIFKASFDKANRSYGDAKRGLGIDKTLEDFAKMKNDMQDLRILTDVHEQWQIDMIEKQFPDVIDVYQIPAFLCRQTDLIQAACATGKTVNIKKGQFMAPWDVDGILSKINPGDEVWITERGTTHGYNNLVVDFTGIQYMLDTFDCDIIFDATHSVQRPSSMGRSSGGNREYVPGMCRAAAAVGVRNFFLEVHDDPDNAPSDGPNMVKLENFQRIVDDIMNISEICDQQS
ncbi:MAG: 3-deoxy-8-phosphooctulonate synthase [Gammaproteobacteria bacterium TMED36]|nr:MAG: 3-deoxy-8-phosphooctulonate synthase [Gammaproteobacteria bacterium TMED36]|tara:strand:- start:2211 stop:3116 length:906 start_codon:yes stop_codon:yes gene_type:complete